jgi:Flp pilus assembly protein TadG
MKTPTRNEAGTIIIAMALFIVLLLCFVAFGTEAGRWYLLRAELSKAVDAGALAGAKNVSNPYVDPRALAQEFCDENFPPGAFGTPGAGTGSATFNVTQTTSRIDVDGHATAPAIMAQLLGIHDVPVSSGGAADMRPVEIMLVLDRSGSMAGQPMADLKVAAKSFLDYFADTQSRDKCGLISFATSAHVDRALNTNFVTPLKTAITNMVAANYTNSEDAIDQADGPSGFTNQNGVPSDSKIQQFLVFFSDGRPNTFRGLFRYKGVTYDAVAHSEGNCDFINGRWDTQTLNWNLFYPDREATLIANGAHVTGDGILPSRCGANKVTARWNIFDTHPLAGYAPDACSIPETVLHDYTCATAADLAVEHAQELKDKDIVVYAIGLGDKINSTFLDRVASGPQQVYIAPTSADLQAIFQKIAKDIKLRLVM